MSEDNKQQDAQDMDKQLKDFVNKLVSSNGELDILKALEVVKSLKGVINKLIDAVSKHLASLKV